MVDSLIILAGFVMVVLAIAASPLPDPFGGNFVALIGPVFAAAFGGYLRHRVTDRQRAWLWALAYGTSVAGILVAMFGAAFMVRPIVRDITALMESWSAVMASGFLVAIVGAFLWERDSGRRRIAAGGSR